MVLTIYLLSLAVAGDVLYSFPFRQNTSDPVVGAALILLKYTQWFALNVGIVFLVAIFALQWPVWEPRRFSREATDADLHKLMFPTQETGSHGSVSFNKGSKVWTIVAFAGVLISVIYDVYG